MNKNEKETKLLDAAEKLSKTYDFWEAQSEKEVIDNVIAFAKSIEVRDYHQQEPKELDLNHIHNMIVDLANDNNWQVSVTKLMMYLKPYIKTSQKSQKLTVSKMRDIERMLANEEISYSRMVEMVNEIFSSNQLQNGVDIVEVLQFALDHCKISEYKTGKLFLYHMDYGSIDLTPLELLEEYKQSKNKSNGKS